MLVGVSEAIPASFQKIHEPMANQTDIEVERRRRNQKRLLQGTPKINFDKPLDYTNLSGRTAIITGGSSGIGLGIAQALLSHGARVAVLDLSPPSQSIIADEKDDIKFFHCDVSNWESLVSAFKQTLLWSNNKLDIVIVSAGLRSHNIKDLILSTNLDGDPIKPPSDVFNVNLLGAYYTSFLALWHFTHLSKSKSEFTNHPSDTEKWKPQLLFLGSLASYVEHPLSTDYCASKHGVRGLWKGIRAHGAVFGDCQMNLLAPTFINNRQGSDKSRGGGSETSLGNDIKMGEVADVVEGALRCICDGHVDGRAVCCVKGDEGKPGSKNFDLCDNLVELNAGQTIFDSFMDGRVGSFGK